MSVILYKVQISTDEEFVQMKAPIETRSGYKRIYLFLLLFFCISNSLTAQSSDYSDSLKYYNKAGQYAKALPFAIKQYEMAKSLEENDSIRIAATYDVGFDYYLVGKYDSAVVYFMAVCDACKKLYGEKSTQYTSYLTDLASAYKNTGKYEIAEALYRKTLSLKKEAAGENENYALSLNQLGLLYFAEGRYNKAEECFLREYSIVKKIGKKTSTYALAAGNLALVYSRIGNYPRAEQLQLEALGVRKEISGEKHPDYALILSNIGTIYANMGNYAKADSIQTIALAITKETLGENHRQYLRGLHNLGANSTNMNNYAAGESFYKQALDGWKRVYGEDDADYLFMFDALSNLYAKRGWKEMAEPLFLQSLARYDKLQISQHPYRLELLYHIIDLYLGLDTPAPALKYVKEAIQAENKAVLDKLDFLSETELLFYLQKRTQASVLAEPYLFLLQSPAADIIKAAYNSRLIFSGISIENRKSLTAQFSAAKDSTLAGLWKNYQNNKSLLNKLLSIPIAKRTDNADSLNEVVNQQEKELLRRSADYRKMKEKLNTTWEDVRNSLKPGEAAVEFVKFGYYHAKKTDTAYYVAMLVRPQDTVPQFVKLFEERQLIAALKTFAYKSSANNRGGKTATGNRSVTSAVYNLLWQPLEPYLAGTQKVFFSPDGLLHRVAFAAIPYKGDSLLCDKYNLVQLTSTRQVAVQDNDMRSNNTIILFGGIDYSKQSTDSSQMAATGLYSYAYQENRGAMADSFRFLPNTLREVNFIKGQLIPAKKNAVLLTGASATEQAFYQLSGEASPDIIHFATHGFTLPTTAGNTEAANNFQIAPNPLLRCGLVMAGGNRGWKGEASTDEDDGILTGLEISAMQLPNTELAVLSACETGLGQIEGSEGVFGLQRAFKLAGVNYIMASLWPVPDKETSEFMENFYSYWLDGETIQQAFAHTQHAMRKKYAPYYWAGFTLVR